MRRSDDDFALFHIVLAILVGAGYGAALRIRGGLTGFRESLHVGALNTGRSRAGGNLT